MLTDQIEKLREEKGLNRIGLNKEKLVEKMHEQHTRLSLEVAELHKHIKDSKLWAVECMEDMKEERMYRGKLEEYLDKIIYERVSGNKDSDYMYREEARMMINNEKSAFKDAKGAEKDYDKTFKRLPK